MSPKPSGARRVRGVVVLTTAMLTFISFWRAAAIVLCDMASTAWYIGGIAETAVGPAAPWLILAVLLFAAPVLALYIEASSMFVRGGVYKVVRESMGAGLAKLSVSSLMFDYVLTGAISAVSAGQYLAGLLNSALPHLRVDWSVPPRPFSVVFALLVVAYFWRQNVRGVEESSEKAVRIMGLVAATAAAVFAWAAWTIHLRGFRWPSFELAFSHESLGWLAGRDWHRSMAGLGLLIAFGHAFLGMSGLETLAQVYREMEAPKLVNLKRAAVVIFLGALALTGAVSFLAGGLIPDEARRGYADNLLSGLAMSLAGPHWALLLLQAAVVLVGVLILSGAVNTSLFGSNGVMNRIAEDGILPDWLRHLHPRFGTTHRMLNGVALLQAATIILCRGDIYLLGEAYAFGVVWSFVFKAAAVTALRFQDASPREWRVPFNLRLFGREWPLGLGAIFLTLLAVAVVNFFTKKVATISGGLFTAVFFAIFTASEALNRRARKGGEHREKINLKGAEDLGQVRAELEGKTTVLVAVRDPNGLLPLQKALEAHGEAEAEIAVLHTRVQRGLGLGAEKPEALLPDEELLFSRVIALAEKRGKTVTPVLVVSNDPFYAMVQTAAELGAHEVFLGVTQRVGLEAQMERMVMTWGALSAARPGPARLRFVAPGVEHAVEV